MVPALFDGRPASRIIDRLWQGGYPRCPREVSSAGFDVIVLAARELQPDTLVEAKATFPGVEVVLAPMDDVDGWLSWEDGQVAVRAANEVLRALRAGKNVLVTCWAGRNRSGLVCALVLRGLYKIRGEDAARIVRDRRDRALTNPGFSRFLAMF